MFYFRIDRVRFLDNGGIKSGLGIFGHDFAKVKFLSFVTPSNQDVPELDDWLQTNSEKGKKAALQTLIQQTISTRKLTEIDRVQDNVPVLFGDTGLVLYEAEEIPESFTWTFIAVRSKRDVREAARSAREIMADREFKSFTKDLGNLLHTAAGVANPAYAAGAAVAKFVADLSARRLMQKGDKQLGAVTMSLIQPEHYPHGLREAREVRDMTGNMLFNYTIFGYKRALPVIDRDLRGPRRRGRAG